MSINQPYFLFLLILIPLPFLLEKTTLTLRFSSFNFIPRDKLSTFIKYFIKFLGSIIIASIAFSLSDIRIKGKEFMESHRGAHIVFVLDGSGSMSENKIKMTREIVSKIVKELKDDRVSLVGFGSSASILSHPTFNHSLILEQIKDHGSYYGGTDFTLAFLRAIAAFNSSYILDSDDFLNRIIIFISDGEGTLDYHAYIDYWIKKLYAEIYWININDNTMLENSRNNVEAILKSLDSTKTSTTALFLDVDKSPIDISSIISRINFDEKTTLKEKKYGVEKRLENIFSKIALGSLIAILLFALIQLDFTEKVGTEKVGDENNNKNF